MSTIACPSTLLARRYSFHSLRMNLNRALTCLCPPWVQVVYLVCYLFLHHLWLLAWWVWGGLSLCGPGASSQQWSIPVLWLAYCTGILAAITFAVSAGRCHSCSSFPSGPCPWNFPTGFSFLVCFTSEHIKRGDMKRTKTSGSRHYRPTPSSAYAIHLVY